MSDFFVTLVPERIFIPQAEQAAMERRMVAWMQENGWLEKEKSDCTLDGDGGWRFTPAGSRHIADEDYSTLLTYGFCVKTYEGKGVFTNLEGGLEEALCPACGENIEEDFYDMVGDWAMAEGSPPLTCPCCGAASDIREYRLDPPWGFSQIGFEFWNIGDIDPEFTAEFASVLGEPVRVVWAHL